MFVFFSVLTLFLVFLLVFLKLQAFSFLAIVGGFIILLDNILGVFGVVWCFHRSSFFLFCFAFAVFDAVRSA